MGVARQTAITSIAKAATLTATGFPLAGEVVALALRATLDEKDEQLEQLKDIQAGGNQRSRENNGSHNCDPGH
jgi:hypothetical protein